MTVLDTSFLIAATRGHPPAKARLKVAQENREKLVVPVVVLMEDLVGYPADEQPARTRLIADRLSIQPFDRAMAERAGMLQRIQIERGARLDWSDCQIAATALILGEPLLTYDHAFDGILGLKVERP